MKALTNIDGSSSCRQTENSLTRNIHNLACWFHSWEIGGFIEQYSTHRMNVLTGAGMTKYDIRCCETNYLGTCFAAQWLNQFYMTEHAQINGTEYDWHLGNSPYLTEVQASHIEVRWYRRTGARRALLYVMGTGFQLRTISSGKGKVGKKQSRLCLTNQETELHGHMHKSHAWSKQMDQVHNFILDLI